MGTRRRMLAVTGAVASVAAVAGIAGSPAAGAATSAKAVQAHTKSKPAKPKPAKCSTDIIGRGPGSAVDRKIEFSYSLKGAACVDGLYTLIVKNTYDPSQIAVFSKFGDGRSKDIFFAETLPWTPTPSPIAEGSDGTEGLCVIGVTGTFSRQGFHIKDIAPDPKEAPCEPLQGGTARAFH
jgi:hypothetical protein